MIPIIPPEEMPSPRRWTVFSPSVKGDLSAFDNVPENREVNWIVLDPNTVTYIGERIKVQTFFLPPTPHSWLELKALIPGDCWVFCVTRTDTSVSEILELIKADPQKPNENPFGYILPASRLEQHIGKLDREGTSDESEPT